MERAPEGYLAFLVAPGHSTEVFFLPTVLAGKSKIAPFLSSVAGISGSGDGSDYIKPQFKKMFWRLLTLKANGRRVVEYIHVFDNSLQIWFSDGTPWTKLP